MNMHYFRSLILVLVFACFAFGGDEPRLSADGQPLPAVTVERKIDVDLPIIGRMLGAALNEYHEIARNSVTSHEPLEERCLSRSLFDWYFFQPKNIWIDDPDSRYRSKQTSIALCPIWAIGILDGRIQSVSFFVFGNNDRSKARIRGILEAIKSSEKQHNRNNKWPIEFRSESNGNSSCGLRHMITVEVPAPDWHIIHHEPDMPAHVANAFRRYRLIKGMTFDQAKIILGDPSSVNEEDGYTVRTWPMMIIKDGVPTASDNKLMIGYFKDDVIDRVSTRRK